MDSGCQSKALHGLKFLVQADRDIRATRAEPVRRVHYARQPSYATAPLLQRLSLAMCYFVAQLFWRCAVWRCAVLTLCFSIVCGFDAVLFGAVHFRRLLFWRVPYWRRAPTSVLFFACSFVACCSGGLPHERSLQNIPKIRITLVF